MKLRKLFQTLIVRPLRRDLLRTSLTVLAVGLGVGVVVAIDLAGDAATGSFRSSLETLAGRTDLEISANGGIDEKWIGRLSALPVNAVFSPVIEAQASLDGAAGVALYGVDTVQTGIVGEDAVLVSRALANRLRLHVHDVIQVTVNDTSRKYRIAVVIDAPGGEFLVLDIAAAQQARHEWGKLDRIDVTLSPHQDFAGAERAIRALLPPAYEIRRPGARSEENQKMLRAFRWNLRVLGYISLVVGAFLIYNTISISVVRRRPEIGVLRALGASRASVMWMFLSEALLFGFAGSALGLVLGRLMAEGAVGLIAQTINSLYASSSPAPIGMNGAAIVTASLAGAAVALASAFAPAREATRVAPAEAMGRGAHEHEVRLHWRRNLALAVLLAGAAAALSQTGPVAGTPVFGYLATLLAIGASALAAPAAVLGIAAATRDPARRFFGPEGMLAGRALAASLGRTSVMAAALATAIAMMTSVGIMVGSFRQTVLVWLETQLRADLYIRPAGRTGAGHFPALSSELPALVRGVPGVAAVDVFSGLDFEYQGERATLGAGDIGIVRRYGRLRFLPGEDRDAILRSLPDRDRAIVSEPFANKHGIRAGDGIALPLGSRRVPVTVAGIYYEYSSERGFVILDRTTLLKYLPGQPATNMAVYLKPGANEADARHAIEAAAAKYHVMVAPNRALREDAVRIFDRTFAITWALEAVAAAVAMLGAANSLLAMVLDRRREFGLLRYLGAAPAQIRRMILIEAGFLGALAVLMGLTLGFALSLLLIFVINRQSFGWTIQFHPPFRLLASAVTLIWGTTVVAGLYPARMAARLNPIDVIHEE